MLELVDISGGYGASQILRGVALRVGKGESVALLGPNGAGKSTLMAAITATLPVRRGRVLFDGRDVSRAPSHDLVAAGIALVPEGRQIFTPFSVGENLRLGAIALSRRSTLSERFEYAYGLFPRLAERRQQRAGTMSGGEQQMVAIARALMSKPSILLLDEPFLGLAPMVVEEIIRALTTLQRDGLTILLVEQKLDIALACTTRAYVMLRGCIQLEAPSAELAARDDLSDLYFSLATDRETDPARAHAGASIA